MGVHAKPFERSKPAPMFKDFSARSRLRRRRGRNGSERKRPDR